MSSSSSSSSPLSPSPSLSARMLEFILKLTKFAGQNKMLILEWLLAWTTVVVFGIRYLIDYAKLRWKLYRLASRVVNESSSVQHGQSSSLCDCISLCPLAHTRKELSVSVDERWERLGHVLLRLSLELSIGVHDRTGQIVRSSSSDSCSSTSNDSHTSYGSNDSIRNKRKNKAASSIAQMTKDWTDDDWIQIFQSNLDVRREASYLMHTLSSSQASPNQPQQQKGLGELVILSKLRRLWPQFLELPESVITGSLESSNRDRLYDISLVVPMYKERVTDIGYTLNRAFQNCKGDPTKIQVVVVHAQSSPDDYKTHATENDTGKSLLRQQLLLQLEQQGQRQAQKQRNCNSDIGPSWGDLKVVTIPFGKGGGRGKTLNVGAKHATAPILTFLHADTMVPVGWDQQIKQALLIDDRKDDLGSLTSFPHACAFTMAIDDSNITNNTAASSSAVPSSNKEPAGLLGAEWLGVLRCHCGLPYGDSVLSFGRPMFDYMGGYPEQPLMEDYEAMDWLRLRSVLLSTIHKNKSKDSKTIAGDNRGAEGLVLLRDRAKCSPRRWQKYGVAYTSLVNAICIFRYRSNTTAEDLFDFYYHCNKPASKQNGEK